jgi:hypothetical protein
MKRLAIVVSMLLVVTACSSEPAEDGTTTTEAAPGGTAGDVTTSTTAAPTTTTTTSVPEESTTTTLDASGQLASCVVGVWELDSEDFVAKVSEGVEDEAGAGAFAFGGGSYSLSIGGDGTFVDERADWTLVATSDFGEVTIVINDRNEGTYSLDGDVLSTTIQTGEPPELEFLVDGEPIEFPGGASPVQPPEAEFTGAVVTCSGDMMTASFEGYTSSWSRSG